MRVQFWGSRPWTPSAATSGRCSAISAIAASCARSSDLHLILENASGKRPQLGLWGWIADSTAAHTFLKPLVACAGDINLSRFCDPGLDALMERGAAASGPEAVETWRRVEAALAKQAPVVPLTNLQDTTVTAERVGNYQHHPLWGALLDQLWVK